MSISDTTINPRDLPPNVAKELTIRLYYWALQDASRETANDFPLVRTIRNANASGFLSYCATVPKDTLSLLARVRVKAFHRYALEYLGETMTREEQESMEESYKIQRKYTSLYTKNFNSQFGPNSVYSSEPEIITSIKNAMHNVFGEECRSNSRELILYENSFPLGSNAWRLATRVEVLQRNLILRYTQSIYLPSEEGQFTIRHPSHRATDILGWLGITPLPTYWDIPLKSDIAPAVASLALVCKHYLDAVPSIIEGLSF